MAGSKATQSAAPTLRASLIRAVSWTGSATVLSYVLQFLRAAIVARLLTPDDYGVFGMAFLVLAAAQVFTEFGFNSSIIASKFETAEKQRSALNTVWTIDLLRRGFLALLLAATAYPVSLHFHDPRVFGVLLAISPYVFLGGFENIGMLQLQKELSFRQVALQKQAAEILTTVATLIVAYLTRNFWALVLSQYFDLAVRIPMSYWLCNYRPRLELNPTVVRHGFSFGKHLFVIGVLTYLTTQFDNLVVGRYLGPSVLGVYLVAYRLAMLPVDILGTVLGAVLFPAYAKLRQEQPSALPQLFLKAHTAGAYALLAIFGILAVLPAEIVRLVYGRKWDAAVPLLAVLVLVGLFRGLARTLSPFLVAVERPGPDAACKTIEVALFIPLTLWWVARHGAVGAAWAGVLCYFVAYLLRLGLVFRMLAESPRRLILELLSPPLFAAAAYFVAGHSRQAGLPPIAAAAVYVVLLSASALASSVFIRREACALLRTIPGWPAARRGS